MLPIQEPVDLTEYETPDDSTLDTYGEWIAEFLFTIQYGRMDAHLQQIVAACVARRNELDPPSAHTKPGTVLSYVDQYTGVVESPALIFTHPVTGARYVRHDIMHQMVVLNSKSKRLNGRVAKITGLGDAKVKVELAGEDRPTFVGYENIAHIFG